MQLILPPALFYKTGMYHTLFEPDASGTYVGSSYINATTRDYARFGLLYYNDGIWNGERILPEGWVKQTMMAPASNKRKNYGYQFWLNGIDTMIHQSVSILMFPLICFSAMGMQDSNLYHPFKKLVVVRLGLTLERSFNENDFLKGHNKRYR
jgi:CubicO group peptidase (beta-lactamase class C family)